MKKTLIVETARIQKLAGLITEEEYINISMAEAEEEEEEVEMDDTEDNMNAPEEDSDEELSAEEPTSLPSDAEEEFDIKGRANLSQLLAKKDHLISKLKAGDISLDQYKAQIGNIPAQIKKIRAKADAMLNISDEED
jgi:hypothetical protein